MDENDRDDTPVPSSSLEWFNKHRGDIRFLYYSMVTFLAVPWLGEYFLRVAPPQLQLTIRVLATSCIGFLVVMICYSAYYAQKDEATLGRKVALFGVMGGVALLVYLMMFAPFTKFNEVAGERVVLGFKLQPDKKADDLPDAAWDARTIYEESGVTVAENLLLLLWVLTTVGISAAFSMFSLQQDQRLIREKERIRTQAKRDARAKERENKE